MRLSIVLPVYNEEKNISILYDELVTALRPYTYEIIAVNDGSKDGSLEVLRTLAKRDPRFKVINFRFNAGQTAAIAAGIKHANGEVVIPMDSDLQNDPADIPMMLEKMEEGYDVVSGWRKNRWKGQWITRKLPSAVANWVISMFTGVHLHDYGCTMKLYRRESIVDAELYGEMHRLIPVYAKWTGARITEVVVNDRVRKFGKSNYGMARIFKVPLDLLLVYFLWKFMQKPIHFFGGIGLLSLVLGFIAGTVAVGLRLFGILYLVSTPLPTFSALLLIIGVQFILMGLIAEMLMRTYYESQGKTPYIIKETINH